MSTLIMNHWDTDGIVSSALLCAARNAERGTRNAEGKRNEEREEEEAGSDQCPVSSDRDEKTFNFFIPPIGQFSLSDEEISEINGQNYDQIFIIDYALQKDIVSRLQAGRITVIDHHFTKKALNAEYFNPVIEGADPDDYPCCVMAMVEYLESGVRSSEFGVEEKRQEKKIHRPEGILGIFDRDAEDAEGKTRKRKEQPSRAGRAKCPRIESGAGSVSSVEEQKNETRKEEEIAALPAVARNDKAGVPSEYSGFSTGPAATSGRDGARPSKPGNREPGTVNREKEYLLESCIAAVGDKEHKILKNPKFKARIEQCEKEQGIDFSKMLDIKELIDSSYITGNTDRIQETIRLIAEQGVLAVLEDQSLKEQRDTIINEKEKLLAIEPEPVNDNVFFFELESEFNLLSAVTRLLSKKHPEKIILTRLKPNVYIRRDEYNIDLKELIDIGQTKGWNIGGKHEVCGIAGCTDEAFEETVKFIRERTS